MIAQSLYKDLLVAENRWDCKGKGKKEKRKKSKNLSWVERRPTEKMEKQKMGADS
jgi:hypothetical protein